MRPQHRKRMTMQIPQLDLGHHPHLALLRAPALLMLSLVALHRQLRGVALAFDSNIHRSTQAQVMGISQY